MVALHQRERRDIEPQKGFLLAQGCLKQGQAVSGGTCALKDQGLVLFS